MDENTPMGEPAFERLLSSFRFHFLLRSTNSMSVGIANQSQSYILLSSYSFSSTLPSRFTLAVLETFQMNHIPLEEVCGSEQLTTMQTPFGCNWQTLFLIFIYSFYTEVKMSLVCRWFQVVVCLKLRYLLNNGILYYPIRYPYRHTLSHLHLQVLVHSIKGW